MTTLCITGTPGRDFDSVSKLLFQGGLATARPIERETTISMEDWHKRVAPILSEQQQPGRLWEQLAGDLLLANFQQPQWGWADPASLAALEFWSELEPGLGFLLLTSDPQDYLAYCLLEGSGDSGGEVDEKACLQQWRTYHERMLAFYLDYPERCLLVNARQARANPSALAEKLQERWGLELTLSSSNFPVLAGNSRQEAPITLAYYVANKTLVDQGQGLTPLRDELKAAQFPLAEPGVEADLDGNILGSANLSLASILRDYQRRCARDLSESERKALESLRRENEQLLAKLRYVQEQWEATTENQQSLEQQLAEAKALPSVSPEHVAELKDQHHQESELLLLQLHQAHEELEATFIKQQQSEEAKAASEEAVQRASIERDALKQQVAQLVEERDEKALQAISETEQRDQAHQSRQRAEQQLEESRHQNELLLLQLNKVQEELEAIFIKQQKSEEAKAASEEAVQRASIERDALKQQVAQLVEERDEKALQAISETEQRDQAHQSRQQAEQQLEESRHQNELLLLQLNKVQEELEHFFLLHQQVSQEVDKLNSENRKLKHQWQVAQQHAEQPRGWLARLGGKPQSTAPKLTYEAVQLRHEHVNPDYEHLWVTLKDASFGEHYSPAWQFRLSCAGIKPNDFGKQPKLELPEQGDQLLQNWFAESESEHGQKLELRFALPNAMDSAVWKKIPSDDQALIRSLLKQLPEVLNALKEQGSHISRDWAEWQQLAANMKRIHQAKAST